MAGPMQNQIPPWLLLGQQQAPMSPLFSPMAMPGDLPALPTMPGEMPKVPPGNAGTVALDRSPASNPSLFKRSPASAGGGGKQLMKEEDLSALLERQRSDALTEQKTGIADQEELLNKLKNYEKGTDYSALYGLSDKWFGTQLAKDYKKPETEQERLVKVAEVQNKINTQKNALTNQDLDYMRLQLQNKMANQAGDSAKDARFKEQMQYKTGKELQDYLQKDVLKPMNERAESLMAMENAIGQGSFTGLNTALGTYARVVGGQKGVLTDKDIEMMLPANLQMSLAKAASYFSNPGAVKLDKEFMNEMKTLIGGLKVAQQKATEHKLGTSRSMFAARSEFAPLFVPGGTADQMYGAVKGQLTNQVAQAAAPTAAAVAPAGPMSAREAIAARAAARAAGGQ